MSGVGLAKADPSTGRFLRVNSKLCEITGYSEVELLSQTLWERTGPDDRGENTGRSQKAVWGEASDYAAEKRYVRKDGTPIWISVHAATVRYGDGSPSSVVAIVQDITEFKRAHEELRQSEQLYRAVVEQAAENIVVIDLASKRILEANAAFSQSLGYGHEELHYLTLYDVVDHERGSVDEIIRLIFEQEQASMDKWRYLRKDGSTVDLKARVSLISYRGRHAMCMVAHDITEHKHIEEELRRREKLFKATFEQAAVGMAQVGLDGRWLRINRKLCEMVGYSREELLRKTFLDITHPEDLDKDLVQMRRLLAGEIQTYSLEKRYLRKDGSAAWTDFTLSLVKGGSEEPDYFVSVIVDITERKRTEDALGEVRGAERTRIARDLHDGPLQDIAYALKGAELVRLLSENEELRGRAGNVIEPLRRAGRELRSAVYNLKLEEVEDKPLPRLLESLVELNQAMVPDREIELEIGEDLPSIAGSATADLLRIFQEALTNVRRHSGAGRVRVALCVAGEELVAEVNDDGHGFAPGAVSGVGTSSMREQAAVVGGDITVESEPGMGTRVRFRAPLSAVSALGREAEAGDVASRYARREGAVGP
jgi:PAS domain S-box-containing protein